jgi:flagellar biosynthesis/type III secretory pathway chaperone
MIPLNDRLATLVRNMKSFLTLLEEESTALASGDSESLSRLVSERQILGLGISDHWKAVAVLLGVSPQEGFAALRDKALSGAAPASLSPAWHELENLAREASRLNQVNGRLIEEQLRRNQAAMQILQSAAANRGLYGADGRVTDFLNVNRKIDTA